MASQKRRRRSASQTTPRYQSTISRGITASRKSVQGTVRTPQWTTPAPSVSMSRRLQRTSRNLGGEDGWGRKTDDGRDATISYGWGRVPLWTGARRYGRLLEKQ